MDRDFFHSPVVQSYLFYSGVLGLKMLGTALLTSKARYTRKVFANEEDAIFSDGVVKVNDPEVERVRRAHLNDLENIPVFWVLGAIYATTNPSVSVALTLFRTFTVMRFIHTFVYAVKPFPQPTRGIVFTIPFLITAFMGLNIIIYYAKAF
ncbi:unnamed protein product [Diatraea saccharalis]|uniref:Microsomal glutathione S-transferase 1 n=1 Tax=Diatraea saccharalis TaxID=40085 RepID=A0A9N9N2W0_9NEOP|nr:unnamed protein product [Diatraea saccharalis]